MIVVDASALIEALLRMPMGQAVNERLRIAGSLHAPHLLDIEVAQVVRRHAARGAIDEARGREALLDLAELPMHRYSHQFLLPLVWELRGNLTAYDAAYVALADILEAPLLTRDKRLAATASPRVTVHLI